MHEAGRSLDDRTWNDLVMDDVFAFLDRTESRIGQQMLYRRLRRAPEPLALEAFEALVDQAGRDEALRERAQETLGQLRDASAHYVHRLAGQDVLVRRWWHVLFPLWTVALVSTLGLGLVASDSATYVQRVSFFDCPAETDTARLDFLYALWGAPLAVLLGQALRVARRR